MLTSPSSIPSCEWGPDWDVAALVLPYSAHSISPVSPIVSSPLPPPPASKEGWGHTGPVSLPRGGGRAAEPRPWQSQLSQSRCQWGGEAAPAPPQALGKGERGRWDAEWYDVTLSSPRGKNYIQEMIQNTLNFTFFKFKYWKYSRNLHQSQNKFVLYFNVQKWVIILFMPINLFITKDPYLLINYNLNSVHFCVGSFSRAGK